MPKPTYDPKTHVPLPHLRRPEDPPSSSSTGDVFRVLYDDGECWGVRLDGRELPGYFPTEKDARYHLAQLTFYRQVGTCPLGNEGTPSPTPAFLAFLQRAEGVSP